MRRMMVASNTFIVVFYWFSQYCSGCYSEIGRILNHLLQVTTQALDVGALTPPSGGSKSAKS